MKERIRMVAVLTLLALVSGLLLAFTDTLTREPIEQARRQEMIEALSRVMPPSDNDVLSNTRVITEQGNTWTFYVGRNNRAYSGAAFLASAEGYGGQIKVMVGLKSDDTINAVEILVADRETPGLGAKIKNPDFLARNFVGRSATNVHWCAVNKDGGEVVAITGATISSRGVTKAIRQGLEVYARHASEIRGQGGN